MEKTLNTIIVLRNDKSTDWASSDVILKEGEVGVSYLDNGNVVVKAGDGVNKWPELKQVEGVFEQPVTLTQNFGYFTGVPNGGKLTFDGNNGTINTAGMTTSEFLMAALKKTVEPTITQPSASISASAVVENNDPEMGAKITALKWTGTTSNGSYKIGSGSDQGTGIDKTDFTFSVSNNIDSQTATDSDGTFGSTFTLTPDKYITINSESSTTYATITADITLDVSGAKDPKNNLGEVTSGKITAASCGTPWEDKTASVKVTGYRKPFWGVKTAAEAIDATNITSAQVRALGNSGTSTKGLPTTTDKAPFVVSAGTQQVFFLAKAGTYASLSATDAAAMNAGVTFTKVENAVNVEGANGFDATAYDMFYVDWKAGIDADKKLVLTWTLK